MGKYNNQDNNNYLLDNNKLEIKSIEELKEAEAFVFSMRAAELERQEYKLHSFYIENFKKLHYHLFQDIYSFAGYFRNVQLKKGSTNFCQFQYIDHYSSYIFNLLNEEPIWCSLKEAAERLAFFKTELNMIHPFREGNGRTIRIFIHSFALSKGIDWNVENMDQKEYMQAMVKSVSDTELLRQLFLKTITYVE